jgi:hypothetical protein
MQISMDKIAFNMPTLQQLFYAIPKNVETGNFVYVLGTCELISVARKLT